MASLRSTLRLGLTALAAVALVAPLAVVDSGASRAFASQGRSVGVSVARAFGPTVDRVGDATVYSTAIALSLRSHPDGADVVYLASGTDQWGGLAAASSAAAANAPLLFTAPTELTPAVSTQIARLAPAEVVIVGGPSSVSDSVSLSVTALGATVTRIDASDLYSASRGAIAHSYDSAETAWLIAGATFADALPAVVAADHGSAPAIIVDGLASTLDVATEELLGSFGVTNVVLVGSHSAVNPELVTSLEDQYSTVTSLNGADAFHVSRSVNAHVFSAATNAVVSSGITLGAGAAATVFASHADAPLYLSYRWCTPAESTADILDRLRVESVTIVGAPTVLSKDVESLRACTAELIDKPNSEAKLVASLTSRIATLDGRYSVSVRELGGAERSIDISSTTLKEPASVMKLYAAYAILKRVDAGKISLSAKTRSGVTVAVCLRTMIHISDNLCHWDLVAMLGNINKLNAELYADGYTNTGYAGSLPGGRKIGLKRTTSSDVALLMSRLERGTLLSPASNARLLALTETQLWRSRIPGGIPRGVAVANKPGELWVASGMVQTDGAIVRSPHGTYVISVLGNLGATTAGIRGISRIVYQHFNGRFETTAVFSANNLVTTTRTSLYRYVGSSFVKSVPAGTRVAAVYSNRNWYRVIYQGRYYWVSYSKLKNVYNYMR